MDKALGILLLAAPTAVVVGGIWIIALAFKESLRQGLFNLLIPFYLIYYAFSRWPKCKLPLLIFLSGPLVAFVIVPTTILLASLFIKGDPDVARSNAAQAQIEILLTALDAYRLDMGSYPTTEEGLQALRVRPLNADRWDGPYLRKAIPPDPWGNHFVYRSPGEHRLMDLISYGADGQPGGEGINADIVS